MTLIDWIVWGVFTAIGFLTWENWPALATFATGGAVGYTLCCLIKCLDRILWVSKRRI